MKRSAQQPEKPMPTKENGMAHEEQPPAEPQATPERRANGVPAPADLPLAEMLAAHRGERHIIVLQNYPDPDAISSAFAHQLISQRFGIETDITYSGKVSHQQNVALLKLLGIGLQQYTPELDLSQYQGAVFVDNQGTTSNQIVEALEAAQVPTLIVVDHHAAQDRLKPEFADIRRTGATATIYAEYLSRGLLPLDNAQRDHVIAATALMHGLLTDTNEFIRANAQDFQAAAFLSQFRDAELLAQIMSQARSKQTMDIIRRALGNRFIVENFSIAGIGFLRAEDRDAIPQAADFLLTEENVHTAIVYGIVTSEGEEMLIGSMRTNKLTLDPDAFIKDTLGRNAAGHYFGGGKMSAGGFEIPIGFLSGNQSDDFRELKWQTYDSQIKHKLLTRLGVEAPGSSAPPAKPAPTTGKTGPV
jgi:nanoRNase/pAp phosphatase (c-di-AMP/oligoRNAs hydrolase)